MADQTFPIGAGSKNFPVKLVDNGDNTYSISVSGAGGGGGGDDFEVVMGYFRVKSAFTGASVGDLISSMRLISVVGDGPVQIGDTIWRNETTQTDLVSAPNPANLEPAIGASGGATNAELVAALNTQTNALIAASYTINGAVTVTGNVGHGTADTGNSVKVGARFVGTAPALTTGQRSDLFVNSVGSLMTTLGLVFNNPVPADGVAVANVGHISDRNGLGCIPTFTGYNWNGTTYDRTKGNTNGTWVQGPVAPGANAGGNPVYMGGIYRGTLASVTNGQMAPMMMSQWGAVMTTVLPSATQAADALANTTVAMPMQYSGSGSTMPPAANFVYNGTTWDRARGDTNGSYMQGPVAAGATSVGNPLLMGAEYLSAPPNLGTGQRSSLYVNNRGNLKVALFDPAGQAAMTTSGSNADDILPASGPTMDTVSYNFMHDYARNRYVRLRGSADGQQVDVAPQMKTAFIMAITATATAAIQLTTGTRRISIVARGADIRYKLGTTNAVVALNTIAAASKDPSILVLQGERVDVNVVGSTYISVIADNDSASKTGSADITEM